MKGQREAIEKQLFSVYLQGVQDGLEKARRIYNNEVWCPNCLKEYTDEPNRLSIEQSGECLHCDHIATD